MLTIGTKVVEFPRNILQVEKFGEVLIVVTDSYQSSINENVWGVNEQGLKIWQIPKVDNVNFEGKEYLSIDRPYNGIYKVAEGVARLFNWEGGYFEINPITGEFTKNIVEFRKGKRPW